jgi:hypothetical protein
VVVKPGHVSIATKFDRDDLTDDEVATLYRWAALYRADVTWRQEHGSGGSSKWEIEISMSDPTAEAEDAQQLSGALADVAVMLRGEVVPADGETSAE